jgi:hypothetical protein
MFDSNVLGTCTGICNVAARIGGLLAPMTAELPQPIPIVMFAVSSTISALAISVLIKKWKLTLSKTVLTLYGLIYFIN